MPCDNIQTSWIYIHWAPIKRREENEIIINPYINNWIKSSLWLGWSIETNKRSVTWVKPLNQIKPLHPASQCGLYNHTVKHHCVVYNHTVIISYVWERCGAHESDWWNHIFSVHSQSLMCITFPMSSISSIWEEDLFGVLIILYIILAFWNNKIDFNYYIFRCLVQ